MRRAHLPPADFYGEPSHYTTQVDRVFSRAWHALFDAPDLPTPGDAAPLTLLPKCLDEPVALVRGADGELRALSNVCTHRGLCVVRARGRRSRLQCGYHGRQWTLNGRFVHMPGFDGAQDFPSAADNLTPLQLGAVGPLRFASLDPDVPFAAWSAVLADALHGLPVHELEPCPADDRDFELDAHWALYVDNYLEGLHVPYVHPALHAALDPGAYRVEVHPHGTVQLGVARPQEPVLSLPPSHRLHGERLAGLYVWLFPNLMVNIYPWGLSLNLVMPRGPRRTTVRYRTLVWDAAARGNGAGGDVHQTEREDDAIVEAVAAGLRSRLYRPGRYSPTHEVGVHAFHRMCAARLA